jgi:iron complex transport system ATP-binding protein
MLTLEGLKYAIDDKEILKGISARFEPFRIHGIVGPNGSGKSTLLKNVCRIWEPKEGLVLINGRDTKTYSRRELSRAVTLVPQNTNVGFPVSVYDIVSMGRNPHLGRFQPLRKKDRDIIDWALK